MVLLGADRDPAWLNQNRPIVHEHALAVFLWDTGPELQVLRRQAPDFLDWVSHRIDVPAFASASAIAELRRLVGSLRWVAAQGMDPPLAELGGSWNALQIVPGYEALLAAFETSDVVVPRLAHEDDVWKLLIAHAQVQWRHRILLLDPKLVPPFVPLVHDWPADWEALAHRLESQGVLNAGLEAALRDLDAGSAWMRTRVPPRVLSPSPALRDLLGAAARGEIDAGAAALAMEAGFHDMAESWARMALHRGDHRAGSTLARALLARVGVSTTTEAVEAYAEVETIEKALSDADVHDIEEAMRLDLPGFYATLGRLAFAAGDIDGARRWFEQTSRVIATFGSLTSRHAAFITGSLHEDQAEVAYVQGRFFEARIFLDDARKLYEDLLSGHPDDIVSQLSLARCLGELGDVSLGREMLSEARLYYERSRSLFESIARGGADVPDVQHDLITTYRRDAALLAKEQRIEESAAQLEVALALIDALRRIEPKRADLLHDLIFAARQLIELPLARERQERWRQELEDAERLLMALDAGDQYRSRGPLFDLTARTKEAAP